MLSTKLCLIPTARLRSRVTVFHFLKLHGTLFLQGLTPFLCVSASHTWREGLYWKHDGASVF